MNGNRTELDNLVVALARWLDAAQVVAGDEVAGLKALEEARCRLASCTGSLPVGMGGAARRGWSRAWTDG